MYHVIINPNCGSGRGRINRRILKRLMDHAKMTYIEHPTSSAGQVSKITRRITDRRLYENNAVSV